MKLRDDISIDVIAFDINDLEANDQLRCAAVATRGKFYTANTPYQLLDSLFESLNIDKNVKGTIKLMKTNEIKDLECMRLSESLEDYLEAIYNEVKLKGEAKVTDISNILNVKKASVTGALISLKIKTNKLRAILKHYTYKRRRKALQQKSLSGIL